MFALILILCHSIENHFKIIFTVTPCCLVTVTTFSLCFAFFQLLNILEEFVISKGLVYSRLDGGTKPADRIRLVRDFNLDASISLCLISTKAGGLGLNFTGANVVIIFDPDWNPSSDLQAQDRFVKILLASFHVVLSFG